MDARRFDRLVKSFSVAETRRGLLRLLPALPLAGWLSAWLDEEDMAADGRRRRRKKRHKHGRGRHRQHGKAKEKRKQKRCRAESAAETCADRCGEVRNNCQKPVDCGSCECEPPCPICQTCDAELVQCVADPAGGACADGRRCCGGECCSPPQTCNPEGVCCTPLGTAEACATAGRECGPADDGCGGTVDCGECPDAVCQGCDATGQCVAASDGNACGDGNFCTLNDTCQGGVCKPGAPVICDPPGPCQTSPGTCDPATGLCTYVNAVNGTPCPGGNVCCNGICTGCCDDSQCADPAQRCCEGTCIPCLAAAEPCGRAPGGGQPDCACACCSGSWVGAPTDGTCLP